MKTLGHVIGIEAVLTSLLLVLLRVGAFDSAESENPRAAATRLVNAYRELIDRHYRENFPLQTY